MKSVILGMAVFGWMLAGSAMAVDMPADGKAKCGACHAIDTKKIGPSWKDIAAKYSGKTDAEAVIAANIAKGGAFGWKMGNMPPKGMGATDAQIKSLAKFIVELK